VKALIGFFPTVLKLVGPILGYMRYSDVTP
jgi:hypothetical protein